MEKGWKYQVAHIGDTFADCLETVIDLASSSASGVVIGYHIHKIDRKKSKVATQIGERVIEMRKDEPDLFSHDGQMVEIFTDLDTLQDARDSYVKEKEEIKQRRDRRVKRYGVVFEPEAT